MTIAEISRLGGLALAAKRTPEERRAAARRAAVAPRPNRRGRRIGGVPPGLTDQDRQDAVLIATARDFRAAILDDGATSAGMCCAVSLPLAGYLSAVHDLQCREVSGRVGHAFHMWLELPDTRILDATADQFNAPRRPKARWMPDVYLGPKPAWYKER